MNNATGLIILILITTIVYIYVYYRDHRTYDHYKKSEKKEYIAGEEIKKGRSIQLSDHRTPDNPNMEMRVYEADLSPCSCTPSTHFVDGYAKESSLKNEKISIDIDPHYVIC